MKKNRILIIAPHPDDETLGLGGAIAKWSDEGNEIYLLTISGHLPPLYSRDEYEITVNEAINAYKVLGIKRYKFLEIPATTIGDVPIHILNKKISDIISEFKPNYVYCPFPDRHIDHKLIFESTLVCTRPIQAGADIKLVAAYETLSETHWNAPYLEPNFNPNLVIDITNYIDTKISATKCYKSQITVNKGPRSVKSVKALAQFRGSQSGFDYGEALYIIRMVS